MGTGHLNRHPVIPWDSVLDKEGGISGVFREKGAVLISFANLPLLTYRTSGSVDVG